MRVVVLTFLFLGSYYFFFPKEKKAVPEIDSIKLKVSAPERAERILTVKEPKFELASEPSSEADASETPAPEEGPSLAEPKEEDLEHVEEVQWGELEDSWNSELKDVLSRLEPVEADNIHKAYLTEQENYQAELDALMNALNEKDSKGKLEVDQLIGELEEKHEAKLREIFGAHYEAIQDHYHEFVETPPQE
jgi:hypothetical protein